MNTFTIKAKLPSFNDVILWNRQNRYAGNKHKKEVEEVIGWSIRNALTSGTLYKPKGRVIVNFEWHEGNKRRDADNIASAKKFILDALVKNEVLIDDSRRYVKGFYDKIIDDKEFFVVVELIDIEE